MIFKGKVSNSDEWIWGYQVDNNKIKNIKDNEIYEVDLYSICSGSGVLDKNNNEIFEGDILKIRDSEYDIVEFYQGMFLTSKDKKPLAAYDTKELYIIGYSYKEKEAE